MKNIGVFVPKNFQFLEVKLSIYLKCFRNVYKIQVMVIYGHAILVTVTSECPVKRVICKTWTGILANSADPDQMLQNAASDQGLHCLLKLQEVKG